MIRSRALVLSAAVALSWTHTAANAGVTIAKTAVNPANGHTYHLLRGDGSVTPGGQAGVSWTEAEAEAQALGGHLVAINDAAEQQWIVETFPGLQGPNAEFDSYLWIGLNDAEVDGEFRWSNGDPVTYTNWNQGEPNNFNGDEDYVHIYNFDNGAFEWNDIPDVRGFPTDGGLISAIVEIVPEPSAAMLAGVLLTGFGCCRLRT